MTLPLRGQDEKQKSTWQEKDITKKMFPELNRPKQLGHDVLSAETGILLGAHTNMCHMKD